MPHGGWYDNRRGERCEFPPGVGAEFIEVKSGLRERKLMDTESSR